MPNDFDWLRKKFHDAADAYPQIAFAAVQPRNCPTWPRCPSARLRHHTLGIPPSDWHAYRLLTGAGAAREPFCITWLRLDGSLWQGCFFDRGAEYSGDRNQQGVAELDSIAQEACDTLAIPESVDTPSETLKPGLLARWLEAVCSVPGGQNVGESSAILLRRFSNIFRASAAAIDHIHRTPPARTQDVPADWDGRIDSLPQTRFGYLVDAVVLGPTAAYANHFPIYNFDCKAVPGSAPTICPRADRKPQPEWLPQIEKRFRELNLIRDGQTIHWVGSQSRVGNVCGCTSEQLASLASPQPDEIIDPLFTEIAANHARDLEADRLASEAHAKQRSLDKEYTKAAELVSGYRCSETPPSMTDCLGWAEAFRTCCDAARAAGKLQGLIAISEYLDGPDLAHGYRLAGRLFAMAIRGATPQAIADHLMQVAAMGSLRDGLECAAENVRMGGPFLKSQPDGTQQPPAAGTPPELRTSEKAASPGAQTAEKPRKRQCLERNRTWLKWYEEIGAESPNVFGQIRDRWNSLSDSERAKYAPCSLRIPKGKNGYDTVRKAIQVAKNNGGNF